MNRLTLHAAVLAATMGASLVAQAPPPVRDIMQDAAGNFAGVFNGPARAMSGADLYCVMQSKQYGAEVVTTNGTTMGLLGGLELDLGDSGRVPNPRHLTTDNFGNLFFRAYVGNTGSELYMWNGVQTILVQDSNPGNPIGNQNQDLGPTNMYAWGNHVYYTMDDGTNGREIWRSDGVSTSMVDELDVGPGDGITSNARFLDGGTTLYIGDNQTYIYKSTGFPGLGTTVDIDPAATAAGYSPQYRTMCMFGSNLMFQADSTPAGYGTIGNVDVGQELFQFNGTTVVNAADIQPGTGNGRPENLTTIGSQGLMYLSANDGVNGTELFRWNGASVGPVINLRTGTSSSSSFPSGFHEGPTGTCFFGARMDHPLSGGNIGNELMMMNAGDVFPSFVDIQAGTGSGISISSQQQDFFDIDATRVAFLANDGTSLTTTPGAHGKELWESDGTVLGTNLGAEIALGASTPKPPSTSTSYLSGAQEILGSNPATRTVILSGKDEDRYGSGAPDYTAVSTNAAAMGALYPNVTSTELYSYVADVTPGNPGTMSIIADWNKPGATWTRGGGISGSYVHDTGMGYGLFAGVSTPDPDQQYSSDDVELYRYDEATNQIAGPFPEVRTNGSSVKGFSIGGTAAGSQQSATTKGMTFYPGYNAQGVLQLFVTNGNPAVMPTEISTNTAGSSVAGIHSNFGMERFKNGVVMYVGMINGGVRTLCGTDGVTSWEIAPTAQIDVPQDFRMHGGRMWFTSKVNTAKDTLWASDGTDLGTVQISTGWQGTNNATLGYEADGIAEFAFIDGKIYLSADNGTSYGQLWKMDEDGSNVVQLTTGTITQLVQIGWSSSLLTSGQDPVSIAKVGSNILFFANDTQYTDVNTNGQYDAGIDIPISLGKQPWKTNGNPGGTVLIETWEVEAQSTQPGYDRTIAVENGLLTLYDEANTGSEVWVSSGFPGSSGLVRDITLGTADGRPDFLVKVSERFGVMRYGYDTPVGEELYASNGTFAGTFLAKSVNPGNGSSTPHDMTCIDGNILFTGYNYQYGAEPHSWTPGLGTAKPYGISSTPAGSPGLTLRTQDGVMGALRSMTCSGTLPNALVYTAWSVAVGQPEIVVNGFHHLYIDALFFSLAGGTGFADANGVYAPFIVWPSSPALINFDVVIQSFCADNAAPKKSSCTNGVLINWGLS